MADLLHQRRLEDAVRLVDDVLLVGELGLTSPQVGTLRQGRAELAARRLARGRAPRGTD